MLYLSGKTKLLLKEIAYLSHHRIHPAVDEIIEFLLLELACSSFQTLQHIKRLSKLRSHHAELRTIVFKRQVVINVVAVYFKQAFYDNIRFCSAAFLLSRIAIVSVMHRVCRRRRSITAI